ncbi:MAG: hypothetical protein GW858_05460 [Sphingomonadales bacterium]|nr:hypothetical protein [Sphingomonadales bacterium]NCQ21341.1 hypothetical protein [Sphingomonadales bacterium]NCT03504.1 hypothetical protein [Sphingomonadales bacterium]
MSGPKDFVTLGALVVLVAGGVWLSATLDHQPLVTEAAAAAIKSEFAWYSDAEAKIAKEQGRQPEIVNLCVDAEPFYYALLAKRLSANLVRPHPVSACKSKTGAADPAAFGSIDQWSHKSGAFAVMLRVRSIRCMTRSRCMVETALMGAGKAYEVTRTENVWTVTNTELLAIV